MPTISLIKATEKDAIDKHLLCILKFVENFKEKHWLFSSDIADK